MNYPEYIPQNICFIRPKPFPRFDKAISVLSERKAKVVRAGDDVTVVTWGMTSFMSFEVAEKLHKEEGISAEVIDLRSIAPLDFETILNSVKKTGKVLIAHEAHLNCGFTYLDAPIDRIGAIEVAIPYCNDLEDAVLPQSSDLEQAIRKLAEY